LSKLNNVEGQPLDVNASANMARQYVQAKQYEKAAKLYEKIAPLDEKLAAWHWKEAATAWLQAGNKTQALDAARKSNESQPEQRSDVLAHFWHKGLADVFLSAGEPKLAIPHYEKAIEKTNIQGYIDASRNKLEEARAKAAE
jgi:tetratricopeptide (TPR) repeat protein